MLVLGTGLLTVSGCASIWSIVRRLSRPPPEVVVSPGQHAIEHADSIAVAVSVAATGRIRWLAGDVRTRVRLLSGDRSVVLTVTGTGPRSVVTGPVLRGVYVQGHTVTECFDPLGVSRVIYTMSPREGELLRVFPPRGAAIPVRCCVASTGESRPTGYTVSRNTEFIESRPYVPGDDPRRIHWTHYAHTGELFVRQGEEVPPPAGTCRIVLDASAAATPAEVDIITSIALRAALSAEDQGCHVSLGLLEGLMEGRTVWYDSVAAARWEWSGLNSALPGRDMTVPPEVDILVTGGSSVLAPEMWQAGDFGLVFSDRPGVVIHGE